MPTLRILPALSAVLALALLTGCVTSRKTTTDRTAIERQLIASSYDRALEQWPSLAAHRGSTFHLDTASLDVPDQKYTENTLRTYLLRNGLIEARTADEADLIVRPTAASAGIDDFQLLLGIPEFSIGAGPISLDTPEISLFKKDWQHGRTRLAGHALDRANGTLAFDLPSVGAESRYIRHTLLIFFTWKWTDLEYPYSSKGKPEKKEEAE